VARVRRIAGQSHRAGDAAAVAADHVRAAAGSVRDVPRLGADGRPRIAGVPGSPAGLAADGAGRADRASDAQAGGVADQVRAAVGSRREIRPGVRADRRSRRAGERPLMTRIRRRAGGALLAGAARARLADHPGPARRAVRLVGVLHADGRAGRAHVGSGATEVGRGAGGACRADDARAVAADPVRAAAGAVRQRGPGVCARHRAGRRAGELTDVARVGGRHASAARRARRAAGATRATRAAAAAGPGGGSAATRRRTARARRRAARACGGPAAARRRAARARCRAARVATNAAAGAGHTGRAAAATDDATSGASHAGRAAATAGARTDAACRPAAGAADAHRIAGVGPHRLDTQTAAGEARTPEQDRHPHQSSQHLLSVG